MNSEIYNNRIDHHFKFQGYQERLTQLVKEKKNLTAESRELKSQKIISKIWNIDSPKIILNSQDGVFKNHVQEQIKKLSLVKPGRKLLKDLINKNLTVIVEPSISESFFTRNINTLSLNINRKSFYSSLNSAGDLYLIQKPLEATVFHELAHKIHPDKNADARKLIPSPISNMDDSEEQWAITGISGDEELDPISENAYLVALNYPCRISHGGVGIPIESILSPIDQILALDYESPEEALKFIKTQQLNLTEKFICNISIDGDSSDSKAQPKKQAFQKQLFPVTAACYFGKKTLVDFLIKENPALREDDDMGGPLKACFEGNEIEVALKVISGLKLPSAKILENVLSWIQNLPSKYEDKHLIIFFTVLLSQEDKCILFKSLVGNHKFMHVLKLLKITCLGDERDANGDTLLMLLIKFFRDVKEKPVSFKYALLFNDLINLPHVFSELDKTNHQGETALSLALQLNNPWLLDHIKNITPTPSTPKLDENENYHGLISTDNWFDEMFEY